MEQMASVFVFDVIDSNCVFIRLFVVRAGTVFT